MKSRALWNHTRAVVAEAPVKVFATGIFLAAIWMALYMLFRWGFFFFQRDALQSAVAIPLLFNFFFVTLLVLLTVSNAILAYGALFTHEEAAYLMAAPLRTRTTVALKYGESLFFSSWSLLLLGMPLMMAIAHVQNEAWLFYPLFIAYFLAFIPIPGALGLLLAWMIVRYLPRSARRSLLHVGVAVLIVAVLWGLQSVRRWEWIDENWLDGFFTRLSIIQASVLPSTWVTRGIEAAVADRRGDALRYLIVLVANGLFLSWFAIHLVSFGFVGAFDRAGGSRGETDRPAVETSGGVAGMIFAFLPKSPRLIAAKDLRMFLRDPLQWSQLAILFGLMSLYLINTPRFSVADGPTRWSSFIPFLNLTAISFILATFTSRFVFPLISMEGHQLWLIGLLPISRAWILVAKFSFAMVVTLSVATGVNMLASYILRISFVSSVVHWAVTASVCWGLCGFAVGIGARLPKFDQHNPARIANGLGGTINLIASVALIAFMLAGMGFVTYRVGEGGINSRSEWMVFILAGVIVLLGIAAGTVAMAVGARHLKRIEV